MNSYIQPPEYNHSGAIDCHIFASRFVELIRQSHVILSPLYNSSKKGVVSSHLGHSVAENLNNYKQTLQHSTTQTSQDPVRPLSFSKGLARKTTRYQHLIDQIVLGFA